MHQIRFRLGVRPRPRWGSLQRFSTPLAGFQGVLLLRGGRGKGRKGNDRKREGRGIMGKWREGKKGREEKEQEGPASLTQIPGSSPAPVSAYIYSKQLKWKKYHPECIESHRFWGTEAKISPPHTTTHWGASPPHTLPPPGYIGANVECFWSLVLRVPPQLLSRVAAPAYHYVLENAIICVKAES